jgi:hypothetical protein
VDTPGFDDTKISDEDVLKTLALWLMSSYKQNVRLSGIVYLHPIDQNRMTGTSHTNLRMLKKLCGDESLPSVVLATTMWSKVPGSEGRQREEQLQTEEEYWHDMIRHGSVVFRHDNTQESAIKIVDYILNRGQTTVLRFQQQVMVDGIDIEKTDAVQELKRGLEAQMHSSDKKIERISSAIQAAKIAGNEQQVQNLQALKEKYEAERGEIEKRHKAELFQVEEMLTKQAEAIETMRKRASQESEEYEAQIQALRVEMNESNEAGRREMRNRIATLVAAQLEADKRAKEAEKRAELLVEVLRAQQEGRGQHGAAQAALVAPAAHALGQVVTGVIIASALTAAVCNIM